MEQIEKIAMNIRQRIFKTAYYAGTGHIAPSLSMVEILTVLYFHNFLRYDIKNPAWRDRDYFIMSKGHASLVLYAILSMAGYFPESQLKSFCKGETKLGGILKRNLNLGIEAGTGSLGQGICFATGIALANQLDGKASQVFVAVGDGECQEGSTWEAAMNAVHHKLERLTVIVDHNKLQGMDSLHNICDPQSLKRKWESFGFTTIEIDGHDIAAIAAAFRVPAMGKPKAIIANTIKGKGISFMEGIPIWHYRSTNEAECQIAMRELNLSREDLYL